MILSTCCPAKVLTTDEPHPENTPMKVVLELQDQLSNIKKVTVRHDIVIGRGAECNLRLSAPQVSRRHCFLRISKDGAFVSDLDSSNGTFLGGNRLPSGKRHELHDGAVLSVGPVKFIARVRSEVVAGEVLQVNVADDRIEAEASPDFEPPSDFSATIASPPSGANDDAMDFAIEHAGPSVGDDEATSDYVATSAGDSAYFANMDDSTASSEEVLTPGEDEDEPTTVADAESVAHSLKQDGVINVDAEDMLVIDDEEIDKIDDSETPATDTDEEDELRNFLNGLE